MVEKKYSIPSTIKKVKKFQVVTKSGRVFYVEWLRKDSELRPSWKGHYMQDTFLFDTKKDYNDFTKTEFFRKNGLEWGCAYHDLAPGAKCTWFVKDAEVERRISHRQFGPRQV